MIQTYELTEKEFQLSEKKYRDLFGSLPIGVYRTSIEGVILDANDVLVSILGFEHKDELLSYNVKQFSALKTKGNVGKIRLKRKG